MLQHWNYGLYALGERFPDGLQVVVPMLKHFPGSTMDGVIENRRRGTDYNGRAYDNSCPKPSIPKFATATLKLKAKAKS